ncbi:hypothetical protein ANCCEY_11557 [Ancylostoma ceylanicum]|uniref:Uncharacterized protein n=2 Tax=Ancylostoma TaxID=29169 RepID=A0A0D6LBC3_9BILA|nr:hypothetical protein ANCCEY_11557 [Ancylostoma ceylanicum]
MEYPWPVSSRLADPLFIRSIVALYSTRIFSSARRCCVDLGANEQQQVVLEFGIWCELKHWRCDEPELVQQAHTSRAHMASMVKTSISPPHASDDFIEAPVFFYDMDYDLKDLNTALKGAEFLQDSGYQSVLERSAHPFAASIVDDILSEGSEAANDEDWGES